jgi:hypothetical protein
MKRYIFSIQYNSYDKDVDLYFMDGYSKENALSKIKKQFPGVYSITFVRIEKEL